MIWGSLTYLRWESGASPNRAKFTAEHASRPERACDNTPLCRHHHRCKQAEGWQLAQPAPGVLIWRTPAGRTYATKPTQYPL